MFVSPFTVSLGCDIAVIVVYLQRPNTFGGTVWFTLLPGVHYEEEMVDIVSAEVYCVPRGCLVQSVSDRLLDAKRLRLSSVCTQLL